MYGNNVCVGSPVCCPPIYNVRDYCTPRIVPVIQPVVNVNRQHFVNVPRVIYQPETRNVVVPPTNQFGPGNLGFNNTLFNTGRFNNVGNNAGFNNRLF